MALGIIRDLNEDPSLRKKPVERVLLDLIDDEGGPLIHNCDSEEDPRSLDSTCRKFRRFLGQHPSRIRQSPTNSPDEAINLHFIVLLFIRPNCLIYAC